MLLLHRAYLPTRLAVSIARGWLAAYLPACSLPSPRALTGECASCNKLRFFISLFDKITHEMTRHLLTKG